MFCGFQTGCKCSSELNLQSFVRLRVEKTAYFLSLNFAIVLKRNKYQYAIKETYIKAAKMQLCVKLTRNSFYLLTWR